MEYILWLIIFITGMAVGSGVQWLYSEYHKPERAGCIYVARDPDGVYLTAGIRDANLLQDGNIVEFVIVDAQNETPLEQ